MGRKDEGKMFESKLEIKKVNMRRLYIGENDTNKTCRKTINQQNYKINVCVGKQFIFKNHCF